MPVGLGQPAMAETDVAEQASTFRDWAGLPGDLLTCIDELLGLPGRLSFRSVCRSWSAALPAMPSPWLVIPDGLDVYEREWFTLLSLPTRIPFRWRLQDQRCIGSSGGWLAFVDAGLSITLLNPLADSQPAVQLPPLGPLRRGGSLHISPCVPVSFYGTLQDYAVAVICRYDHGLAFTRAGSDGWQWLDWPVAAGRAAPEHVAGAELVFVNDDLDLVYHDGKFYYMTLCGQIWSLDAAAPSPVAPVRVAKWRPPGPDYRYYGKHIVFTDDGALHVVWSDVPGLPDANLTRPMRMHVRRHDPAARGARRRWRKVRHLGGSAFLIGQRNQSVAVPAASLPATWLRPNCVYFTNIAPGTDNMRLESEPEEVDHIWEFDVEAGSFRSCDRGGLEDWFDCPKAIWFTPRVESNGRSTNEMPMAQLID